MRRHCHSVLVSLAVTLLAIVTIWGTPGCAPPPPPPEGKRVGETCPDITGTDVNGKTIRLSDYRGKVVLVNFWGTWCAPCRAALPREREKAQSQFAGRPFTILGVAGDSPDKLREFLKTNQVPWPNIADGHPPGPIIREWDIDRFPSAMLIDHAGVIKAQWFGNMDFDEVWLEVERAVRTAQS
jgi:peroxiredoxin